MKHEQATYQIQEISFPFMLFVVNILLHILFNAFVRTLSDKIPIKTKQRFIVKLLVSIKYYFVMFSTPGSLLFSVSEATSLTLSIVGWEPTIENIISRNREHS